MVADQVPYDSFFELHSSCPTLICHGLGPFCEILLVHLLEWEVQGSSSEREVQGSTLERVVLGSNLGLVKSDTVLATDRDC